MITIPRSHKTRITSLKKTLTRCRVYSLSNEFAGKECSPEFAWQALQAGIHGKLTDDGNGTYTIHVHGNLWYELTEANPAKVDDRAVTRRRYGVLGAILLAMRNDRDGAQSWAELRSLACQYGAGFEPPVTPAEVDEMHKMTLGQITGHTGTGQ